MHDHQWRTENTTKRNRPTQKRSFVAFDMGPIISTTAGDTDLVPMKHLNQMATWESNGHMTYDAT